MLHVSLDAATGSSGALVHGRFDVSGPLEVAWELSKRWRTSTLHVVDDAGHGGGSFASAVIGALSVLPAPAGRAR